MLWLRYLRVKQEDFALFQCCVGVVCDVLSLHKHTHSREGSASIYLSIPSPASLRIEGIFLELHPGVYIQTASWVWSFQLFLTNKETKMRSLTRWRWSLFKQSDCFNKWISMSVAARQNRWWNIIVEFKDSSSLGMLLGFFPASRSPAFITVRNFKTRDWPSELKLIKA